MLNDTICGNDILLLGVGPVFLNRESPGSLMMVASSVM